MKVIVRLMRRVFGRGRRAPPAAAGGLPAMARALVLQRRAAAVGFDWPDPAGALAKLDEERAELAAALRGDGAVEEELGDLFFTLINLTRLLNLEPEAVLQRANSKFAGRFGRMEALARARGLPLERLSLDALERLWASSKSAAPREKKGCSIEHPQ